MMDLTLTADGFIVNAAYRKIVAEELGVFSRAFANDDECFFHRASLLFVKNER